MTNKKTVYIPNIGIAEVSDYKPTTEVEKIFTDMEKQADEDVAKKKQTANVNFRWSEFEIARAKKIAEKLGLPYQTYIKMTLKQAMDIDEKKLM